MSTNTLVWITLLTPEYKDQLLLKFLNAGFTFKFIGIFNNIKTEGAVIKLSFKTIDDNDMWGDVSKMQVFKNKIKTTLSSDILYHSIVIHPEDNGSMIEISNIDIKQYNKKRLINLLE